MHFPLYLKKLLFLKEVHEDLQLATNNNEEAVNEILERIQMYDEWLEQPEAADGLYTSLVHCDMWINNIMFKYGTQVFKILIYFVISYIYFLIKIYFSFYL